MPLLISHSVPLLLTHHPQLSPFPISCVYIRFSLSYTLVLPLIRIPVPTPVPPLAMLLFLPCIFPSVYYCSCPCPCLSYFFPTPLTPHQSPAPVNHIFSPTLHTLPLCPPLFHIFACSSYTHNFSPLSIFTQRVHN